MNERKHRWNIVLQKGVAQNKENTQFFVHTEKNGTHLKKINNAEYLKKKQWI